MLFGDNTLRNVSQMALICYRATRSKTVNTITTLLSLGEQISEQLWSMRTEQDLSAILTAIRAALDELDIPFSACGINHVDDTVDPPVVRAHSMEVGGTWQQTEAESVRTIPHSWLEERVIYRSDLESTDEFDEAETFRRLFDSPVRSVVDIPFSHGTLAVNAREPDAFSEQDLTSLQYFAHLLSAGLPPF